jgi:hypothetical protein
MFGSIPVSTVAVDVERLGVGSLHGVVVLVKRGHEERGRAIGSGLDFEVGHADIFYS